MRQVTFEYPTDIKQLNKGDIYQVRMINFFWSQEKEYDPNMCSSEREFIKHLVKNNRLRIRKISINTNK